MYALVQQYSSIYFRSNAQTSSSFKMCPGELCKVNTFSCPIASYETFFRLNISWKVFELPEQHNTATLAQSHEADLFDWPMADSVFLPFHSVMVVSYTLLMKRFVIWRFQKQNPLHFFLPLKHLQVHLFNNHLITLLLQSTCHECTWCVTYCMPHSQAGTRLAFLGQHWHFSIVWWRHATGLLSTSAFTLGFFIKILSSHSLLHSFSHSLSLPLTHSFSVLLSLLPHLFLRLVWPSVLHTVCRRM